MDGARAVGVFHSSRIFSKANQAIVIDLVSFLVQPDHAKFFHGLREVGLRLLRLEDAMCGRLSTVHAPVVF